MQYWGIFVPFNRLSQKTKIYQCWPIHYHLIYLMVNFMMMQMNATDRNWWFMSLGAETRTIGYWPQALFPNMIESFPNIEWGGYWFNDPKTTTSPQMGSGRFSKEGYGKAAYFRDIQLMRNTAFGFDTLSTEEVSTFSCNSDCYRVGEKADLPGFSTSYNFYYGGLGGNCNP